MTELIQAYLEDEGYANFVVTNDPCEALAMLRPSSRGVLLLDLMMPGMSGFEVLEAIRAEREFRYTPVIVLTASTDAKSKLRALQLGATDFLSKPVDPSELGLRLRNTLAFHEYHNRMINFDAVTSLPNGRLFDRGIDDMLHRLEHVGGLVAHFSVTIPEYRQLRESVGQGMADELARAIASRLDRFAQQENPPTTWSTNVRARAARGAPVGRTVRPGARRPDRHRCGRGGGQARDRDAVRAAADRPARGGAGAAFGIAVAPADGESSQALRKSADLAATARLAARPVALQVRVGRAECEVGAAPHAGFAAARRGAARRAGAALPAEGGHGRSAGSWVPRRWCAGSIPTTA